jgi:phospholipase/carboxylesterase
MRKRTLGGLDVCITGGTDREGGGDGPVVVLLHGFGAPSDDLVSLWRVIDVPRETRFVFPAAPIALGGPYGEGRAWWEIDVGRFQQALAAGDGHALRELTREVPEGLDAARTAAVRMLDALDAELRPSRVVLGGFSQGAMLSLDIALRTPRPLAGLVLMSATLIAADEWASLFATRRGLRVLQSHGREDPLLPFPVAELLRDLLRDAGFDVTWIPFRGGHAIPDSVLDGLSTFVRAVVV